MKVKERERERGGGRRGRVPVVVRKILTLNKDGGKLSLYVYSVCGLCSAFSIKLTVNHCASVLRLKQHLFPPFNIIGSRRLYLYDCGRRLGMMMI